MGENRRSWSEILTRWMPKFTKRYELPEDTRSTHSAPTRIPVSDDLVQREDQRSDERFRQEDRSEGPFRQEDRPEGPFRQDDRLERPFRQEVRSERAFKQDRCDGLNRAEYRPECTSVRGDYRDHGAQYPTDRPNHRTYSPHRQVYRTDRPRADPYDDLYTDYEDRREVNCRQTDKRRQKDPKPFDSVKIEWGDYHKHFEAVSAWNGWDDELKAQQLVMSFDGEALKLLGELSDDVLENYDLLVAELNRRYNPTERISAWKIEFRNRMKLPNETLTQYAQGLKRLVAKAYPNLPVAAQEQFVLDQFSLGLSNLEMKRHVQFGHPRTLNEALSLSIEFDAFESGNRDKLRKPPSKTGEVFTVSETKSGEKTKQNKEDVECFYCHEKGHYRYECPKLKKKLEREAKEKSESGN
jgi:hypothetical protein